MEKETTKTRVVALLRSTEREGIEALISYLEANGFFESPASTKWHGCYAGGLAEHSLHVHDKLHNYSHLVLGAIPSPGQQPLPIDGNTFIIAALLHDVCKMGAYLGEAKPYKWNRSQPKGHALLSIVRVTKYIKLTELEELMIRYHMGVYGLYEFDTKSGEYPLRGDDTKSKEERRGKSMANAWHHNPIVKLMYFCDEIATLEEIAKERTVH